MSCGVNKLDVFLNDNCIDRDELMNALHLDIREIILKSIINSLKNDGECFKKAKQYYFKYDNVEAARRIILFVCNLKVTDEDIKWFDKCFKSYFNKKDRRSKIPQEVKMKLLTEQKMKCAKCGTDISLATVHVDHIIPWDFVGDELEDNLQGLCSDCNLHKSNHVAEAVTNIILKH